MSVGISETGRPAGEGRGRASGVRAGQQHVDPGVDVVVVDHQEDVAALRARLGSHPRMVAVCPHAGSCSRCPPGSHRVELLATGPRELARVVHALALQPSLSRRG